MYEIKKSYEMNIYAIKGHKVKLNPNSYKIDEVIEYGLELDKIYTIEHTDVHSSSTSVYILGHKRSFNSVNFIDVEKQTLIGDVQHRDYFRYCDSEHKEYILNKVNKMKREAKLKRILNG